MLKKTEIQQIETAEKPNKSKGKTIYKRISGWELPH